MGRECLYQDAHQIDTSKYTHVHFGFGTLTPLSVVQVADALSLYQFSQFKGIKNAKRILSFGGWDFSTEPDTYFIFRNGVKPANRFKMATNIANFIKKHDLDGADIDWEYPGAPDLQTSPTSTLARPRMAPTIKPSLPFSRPCCQERQSRLPLPLRTGT